VSGDVGRTLADIGLAVMTVLASSDQCVKASRSPTSRTDEIASCCTFGVPRSESRFESCEVPAVRTATQTSRDRSSAARRIRADPSHQQKISGQRGGDGHPESDRRRADFAGQPRLTVTTRKPEKPRSSRRPRRGGSRRHQVVMAITAARPKSRGTNREQVRSLRRAVALS